jgi:hypothetical protein
MSGCASGQGVPVCSSSRSHSRPFVLKSLISATKERIIVWTWAKAVAVGGGDGNVALKNAKEEGFEFERGTEEGPREGGGEVGGEVGGEEKEKG